LLFDKGVIANLSTNKFGESINNREIFFTIEKFKENHKPLEAKSDYDDTNSFKQLKKRRNDDSNLNLEQKKGTKCPC
jgi:hypothetical protein